MMKRGRKAAFFVINYQWLITLAGLPLAKVLKNTFIHKFASNGLIVLNSGECHTEDYLIPIRQD